MNLFQLPENWETLIQNGVLNFSCNYFGDDEAKTFSASNKIGCLILMSCAIGDDGAVDLAQNNRLRVLDLSNNAIGDKGMIALAGNSTITNLDLSKNNIGDDGVSALAANNTLTKLYLGGNPIGNKGLVALHEWQQRRKQYGNPVVIEGVDLSDERIRLAKKNVANVILGQRGLSPKETGRIPG